MLTFPLAALPFHPSHIPPPPAPFLASYVQDSHDVHSTNHMQSSD